MFELFVLLLCIIPSSILLFYIYKNDKIEKEPSILLTSLFIDGIISALITTLFTVYIKKYIPFLIIDNNKLDFIQIFIKYFLVVSLVEELSKWGISYLVTIKNNNFNYIYDGIIYCCFVSLGFATYENIIYCFNNISYGLVPILLRGIISVPIHCVLGIIMGYYLSIFKQQKRLFNLLESIIIPCVLHFIYDLLLAYNLYYIFVIYIIILFIIGNYLIKKFSTNKKKLP